MTLVSFKHPSNILVIGGAGFIGTHLVNELSAAGHRITVLDKRSSPLQKLPEDVRYIEGDFAKPDLIKALLDTHQVVIHLAYASVPNTSFENPFADLLENLPPTVQLFAEAAERGGKVIFVSSGGTVYGEAIRLPVCEDHPTRPISPYGVTKLTLENYAHLYAVTHGLKFVCLRPANAYGEGQRPFAGQGFIATAMASIMRGDPVRIFGQQGTVRDYIHVSDLVSGIVHAMEKGRLSETYNLGSGVGRSNMDIIEAITPVMKKAGYAIRVENLPERPFDVRANILDSTKLGEHTGWKPCVDFDAGLVRTYTWLKDYRD